MAARLWTNGYDFYAPNGDVAYHLYSPNDAKIRPVFWEEGWSTKWKIARDSEYRINFMMDLHMKFHPYVQWEKYDLREIEKYGLGDKRDILDFWNFTRINLDDFKSEDLCPEYKAGGMDRFRVPWNDHGDDPYLPIL